MSSMPRILQLDYMRALAELARNFLFATATRLPNETFSRFQTAANFRQPKRAGSKRAARGDFLSIIALVGCERYRLCAAVATATSVSVRCLQVALEFTRSRQLDRFHFCPRPLPRPPPSRSQIKRPLASLTLESWSSILCIYIVHSAAATSCLCNLDAVRLAGQPAMHTHTRAQAPRVTV